MRFTASREPGECPRPITSAKHRRLDRKQRRCPVAAFDKPATLDRRSLLKYTGAGLLGATSSALCARAAPSHPTDSRTLARRWIDSINRHDETGLRAILGANFLYSAMVRNP